MTEEDMPVNDDQALSSGDDNGDVADQSFREHAAKLREKRREKGAEKRSVSSFSGGDDPRKYDSGNPLAPMSGGLGGSGSRGEKEGSRSDELTCEVRQLRDELRNQTRVLNRIADALENT